MSYYERFLKTMKNRNVDVNRTEETLEYLKTTYQNKNTLKIYLWHMFNYYKDQGLDKSLIQKEIDIVSPQVAKLSEEKSEDLPDLRTLDLSVIKKPRDLLMFKMLTHTSVLRTSDYAYLKRSDLDSNYIARIKIVKSDHDFEIDLSPFKDLIESLEYKTEYIFNSKGEPKAVIFSRKVSDKSLKYFGRSLSVNNFRSMRAKLTALEYDEDRAQGMSEKEAMIKRMNKSKLLDHSFKTEVVYYS